MPRENQYAAHGGYGAPRPAGAAVGETDRSWLVLLHLSQFCGYLVPLGGFLAPIAIWLLMKDGNREMDRHGRIVVNWIATEVVYTILCIVLAVTVIGIPVALLVGPILLVLGVVFPIVGAIKASNGVAWRYPTTIKFV